MRQSHVPEYVDRDRSDQNSVIVEPLAEADLRRICLERRTARGMKRAMKKDAAIATIGIITFGKEAQPAIEALSVADQDALYLKTAQRIAQELKSDVSGLVVHRDETAPHAHFQMPAYNSDGMPLSKVITPAMAKKLQDIAGEVYAEHGISRGKPKAQRIADGEGYDKTLHRSVYQLQVAIPREIAEKEKRSAALDRENEAKEKRGAALDRGNADKEKRSAALDHEIQAKEKSLTEMHREIATSTPPPPMPNPKAVEVKTGWGKSASTTVYDAAEIEKWKPKVWEWATATFTKTNLEKSTELDAREYAVRMNEDAWTETNDALKVREQRIDTSNAENRRFKLSMDTVGRHLGDIAGVANASMNAGKTYRIFAEGNFKSLPEFQQALAAERVELSMGRSR
jgi:hypothetical protein